MTHPSFVERFRDLPNVVHKSWEEIARMTTFSASHFRLYFEEKHGRMRSPHLQSLHNIAHSVDLIPVVLYHVPTDQPENLGVHDFLAGEPVDNYVRRVILQEKNRLGLTIEKLAWKSGLSPRTVSQYERAKSDLTVRSLDSLCPPLGLVADYLVVKKRFAEAMAVL
ncbi:MAG: helix-turn-helix transcriptional regulator [Candidatus Woesearchaeota archaeon]|nr:helix-turn-helix transcriptional regulator [Candidatus Woesearchaeota archaeon]